MQIMAEAWLVLTLTHSGAAVGATFAFRLLPVLLFGLWGGALADPHDRPTVLLVTQSPQAGPAIRLLLRGPTRRVRGLVGVAADRDQVDDRPRRGGGHARLHLPDLPDAAGP